MGNMVWWLRYRIDSWASISEIVLFDITWVHVLDTLSLISSEYRAMAPGINPEREAVRLPRSNGGWWWVKPHLHATVFVNSASLYIIPCVHSCQQKSIGLKFSKSQTGSDVRYSCHHNSSHFTFPIFAHSCRFSILHSLQSITPRIY